MGHHGKGPVIILDSAAEMSTPSLDARHSAPAQTNTVTTP
jgi:hypothetical protein